MKTDVPTPSTHFPTYSALNPSKPLHVLSISSLLLRFPPCPTCITSRIIGIQAALTERALELLALPQDGPPCLLLDLGCGSGLSGEALSEAGLMWVGLDISAAMLDVAAEREVSAGTAVHE